MDTAAKRVEPAPSNVVALTDKICQAGEQAAPELERKRQIAMRAFEIAAGQMERDAEEIEKSAIVGEHPLKKRYEMLHTSEALRIASGWLRALLPDAKEGTNG